MDNHNASFGRSSSMPSRMQPEREAEQERQPDWEHVYGASQRALQGSPGFQEFRNSTARVWAPDRTQFFSPGAPAERVRYGGGNGSSVNSPASDVTMKHATGRENHEGISPPIAPTPGSPDSEATIVPDVHRKGINPIALDGSEGLTPIALDRSLADIAVFNFPAQQQSPSAMRYVASPWNLEAPVQGTMEPHSRTSSGAGSEATFVTDYSYTRSVGSEDSNGCMSPSPYRHPKHVLRTPTSTDTVRLREDLHVPGATLPHRRLSSRLSSLPGIPSPLGFGHVKRDGMESDVSGLVSPLPGASSGFRGAQRNEGGMRSPMMFGQQAREEIADGKQRRPSLVMNKGFGMKSPIMFGLQAREEIPDGKQRRPSPVMNKGFGHSRKYTDPFVEHTGSSPAPSPRAIQPPKHFSFPHPSSARTLTTPTSQPFAPATPPFRSFLPPPTRVEPLPIPPSPLSNISGKLDHGPEARARLDTQKVIREDWIRSEAKNIVHLNLLMAAAGKKYQQTGAQADHEVWQAAVAAFSEATDTEKRMAERRDMFLPQGTTALRTGPGNTMEDGSAALPVADGEQGEEGRLLGFRMALMERVCAEVKRREDEDKGEITAEMLATLSLEEKKALREHLVGRLARKA